jgi:LPS-assembly protein
LAAAFFLSLPVSLALLAAAGALAQEEFDSEQPSLLTADEVTYDESLGVVVARGNVEISQRQRVLKADTISYNVRTRIVTASGNISLTEPNGDIVFAEYVQLTDDLAEGFIQGVSALLVDDSRLAAARGYRQGDRQMTFERGVFSPCALCRDDPTRAPLWQIKAAEITHDQAEQTIEYRDARMEIFGVPIAYTPYFEHPDPTVERKQGFLTPSYISSDTIGYGLRIPYYWPIGLDKNFTLTPLITTDRGIILAGNYEQIFESGVLAVEASATYGERDLGNTVKDNEFRGHLFSYGEFVLNQNWRTDFQVELSTDDTYLRVYEFDDHTPLETRGTVEYFEGRRYGYLNSYFFDGQRSNDDDDESPIILPEIGYSFVSEPWEGNGFLEDSVFRANSDVLAITRIEGQDVRRVAFEGEWTKPYLHSSGSVFTFKGSLVSTLYAFSDSDPNSDAVVPGPGVTTNSGTTGRIFHAAAAEWRYPLVSNQGWINQTIEPIVQFVAAPEADFLSGDDIPNEDSRDVEFDDSNLFSLNRFPGVDRVSGGSRVDYGFRWTGQSDVYGYGEFLIGQSYRFTDDNSFSQPTGLAEDLSDIVGRLSFYPDPTFGASYRFRLDKDDFDGRRHDLDISVGPPAYRVSMGYLLSAEETTPGNSIIREEELQLGFSSRLNKFWYFSANWIKDMNSNETRSIGFGLLYRDECCDVKVRAEREFYQDREIEPGDTIFVEVFFKHLGGVQGGN